MSPTHEGLGNWAFFQMTTGSMSLGPRRHNKLYYIILFRFILCWKSHDFMEMCDINGQSNTLDNDNIDIDIDIKAAKRTPPPQLDNGNDDNDGWISARDAYASWAIGMFSFLFLCWIINQLSDLLPPRWMATPWRHSHHQDHQHHLQRCDNHTNAGWTTRAEGGDDGARAWDVTVSSPWYVFFLSFYALY